jgi:hypothetical protein
MMQPYQYADTFAPADEMNLQQKDQLRFDFMEHLKTIGNQILSMFKKKEIVAIES